MIYQVYKHTEKVMKYKKNTKEKSESVTVPKQFKTPECFFYTNSIHP